MNRRRRFGVLIVLCVLSSAAGLGFRVAPHPKQVFPPRSQGQPPTPSAIPAPGLPPPMVRTIPFGSLLGGDFTKSFVVITNLKSPMDSNFVLGRGLTGRLALERHIFEAPNGGKVYFHVNALSNPPSVTSEGNELHLQFMFHAMQFKGYYRDYSNEGDVAMPDATADRAVLDVYLTPATDPKGLPTYGSTRVAFAAELKEPDKCTVWYDLIFPVNMCSIVKDYLKQMKPLIESGVRDALHHPQTRYQFDQTVWPYVRGELLMQARLNPASPAQVDIIQAAFKGTDYIVSFIPHP